MKRWSVRKQDGAWQAWDTTGFLRYASTSWANTLAFASMGVHDRRRAGFFAPTAPQAWDAETSEEFRQALRDAIQDRIERYKEDGEES